MSLAFSVQPIYNTEISLFVSVIPQYFDAFSHLGITLNISSREKWGCWIRNPSRRAISTSALLCNRVPPKCCFNSPNEQGGWSRGSSRTPATILLSSVCCWSCIVLLKAHASSQIIIQYIQYYSKYYDNKISLTKIPAKFTLWKQGGRKKGIRGGAVW
jgi:hypothetical protein